METESLWDRIKTGIRDGASTAAERAEYFGRIGRTRLDIAGARHAIHEAFAELGGSVYNTLQTSDGSGLSDDPIVQSQISKIRDLEELLKERETNLEALRSGAEEADSDLSAG